MSWQVIHGDCLEAMRGMADNSVDAVITDPPYPGLVGGIRLVKKQGCGGVATRKHETVTVGDNWNCSLAWCAEAWRVARLGLLVFCSYRSVVVTREAFPDAKTICLLTWFKRNSSPALRNVPKFNTEFVWGLEKQPGLNWRGLKTTMFDIPMPQAGCFATERILRPGSGQSVHPTQKPVSLMRELLAITVDGQQVLDPFCGTGTTGVACAERGRNFIGVEISGEYCRIARARIDAASRQGAIPFPNPRSSHV